MRRVAAVPPFTNPLVREVTLRTVRRLKRARRILYEACGSSRFSRPAINDLDAILERHLPNRPGFFVEAGAHDGFTASNTYFLERFRGWTGVLIEPIPSLYTRCARDRPRSKVFNCALVPNGGPEEVPMIYHGPQSRITGPSGLAGTPVSTLDWERAYRVSAQGRTLTSVLDEAGAAHIDLLVIDVEGHEVDVLRGLNLDRYAPELMLIETNGAERKLQDLLAAHYELIGHPSGEDALFKRLEP